jgi:teichuronic acid exporter
MKMREKSMRSGAAVMITSLTSHGLRAVSVIVLARLLDPNDFGIVSLAAVLIGATELFSGIGMQSAIIASKEKGEEAAYHGMCVSLLSGTCFTLLLLGLAPQIAAWFGRAELTGVIRWMSVLILLQTISMVPHGIMMKSMEFRKLVIPNTLAPAGSMVVSIGMAYAGYGFWSLVGGQIAGGAVHLGALLVVCPNLDWMKPRKWSRSVAGELVRFGVTNMGTGVVRYVYNQGDYVVVGKALGTTALGFYTQAYNLANLPVNTVSSVANTVLFPAYAKIRDDSKRLAGAFLDSFGMVSALSVPMAIGLLILAPDFVIVLLGEKWRSSIPVLQAFSILSFLRPLSGTTSPLFLAINRPGYNLRTAIIQCISMFGLILLLLRWGITGVGLAVSTAFFVGIIYNLYLVVCRTGLPIGIRALAFRLWPVLGASMVMACGVVGLREILVAMTHGSLNLILLSGLVVTGIGMYVLSLFLLNRKIVTEALALAQAVVRRSPAKGKEANAM